MYLVKFPAVEVLTCIRRKCRLSGCTHCVTWHLFFHFHFWCLCCKYEWGSCGVEHSTLLVPATYAI